VGQGLTTSAAATLIAFTFEELNLHRVWAGVIPDNMPSAAICRKLNMRLEGQCKKAIFINRHWQDTQLFALLETEYEEIAEDWINKGFLGT
jgi:RimJ/RimL family protein N-acetyltransferase